MLTLLNRKKIKIGCEKLRGLKKFLSNKVFAINSFAYCYQVYQTLTMTTLIDKNTLKTFTIAIFNEQVLIVIYMLAKIKLSHT